jgi:hypothetical protein
MKAALKRLSPLPIVIQYGKGAPTANDMNYLIAAIRCRDRVRGITFRGEGARLENFLRVMTSFFPVLESLEIHDSNESGPLVLPSRFLRGSAPNLRILKLGPTCPSSLSHVFSIATGLVELSLNLKIEFHSSLSPTSLIAYLHGLHRLCRFRLNVIGFNDPIDVPTDSTGTEIVVRPLELTSFHYFGPEGFFEAFVALLTVPSLQDFCIYVTHTTPMVALRLSHFISQVEEFSSIQLFLEENFFRLSFLPHSQPLEAVRPAFTLNLEDDPQLIMKIIGALSAKLSTVEGLLLTPPSKQDKYDAGRRGPIPWSSFLSPFISVKILQLHPRLVPDIVQTLLSGHDPDILPALEKLELRSELFSMETQVERVSAWNDLRPFVTSRNQAGRPVEVSWKGFYEGKREE